MISPELLRRYPFFGSLTDTQLKAIAMLSEEVAYEANQHIFEAGQAADRFYFLVSGSIVLYFVAENTTVPDRKKFFYVGHVNPEEPFGISALIEPYCYTATATTGGPSRIVSIKANDLRALYEADDRMALVLMRHVAQVAMARLHAARIELVGAYSKENDHAIS
jgi:CRP-like cAMP-binding protein